MTSFTLGGHPVGANHPTFIIAELSANHNGKLDRALRTIEAAAQAGADAIKLQTYRPDTITLEVRTDLFRLDTGTVWDGRYLWDLYTDAHTPWEWHEQLFAEARNQGLIAFSSPFDPTAVDFLESLNAPAYKIASFEIGDIPLIRHAAKTQKPLIISTGIAQLEDIERAVSAARAEGNDELALLKCTSAYPAPLEEANLLTIPNLAETFGTVVGLSDHTLGIEVAIGAVALGASIVEKHFTLERAAGGPDATFSLEPAELSALVRSVRNVQTALGEVRYAPTPKAEASRKYGRSLFIAEDVAAGETLTRSNVRSVRPSHGLPPHHLAEVLGRRARRPLEKGTPLAWNLID